MLLNGEWLQFRSSSSPKLTTALLGIASLHMCEPLKSELSRTYGQFSFTWNVSVTRDLKSLFIDLLDRLREMFHPTSFAFPVIAAYQVISTNFYGTTEIEELKKPQRTIGI